MYLQHSIWKQPVQASAAAMKHVKSPFLILNTYRWEYSVLRAPQHSQKRKLLPRGTSSYMLHVQLQIWQIKRHHLGKRNAGSEIEQYVVTALGSCKEMHAFYLQVCSNQTLEKNQKFCTAQRQVFFVCVLKSYKRMPQAVTKCSFYCQHWKLSHPRHLF